MTTRSRLVGSIFVALVLGALASPAYAVKQTNYSMGASCQPATLLDVLTSVTYTNSGIMVNGLTIGTVICPISWSKQVISTWQNLEKVDIQVDWLGLPSGTTGILGPNWGCSLAYQSAGGSLSMQNLPIPYPIPATLANVAYAALICTVPPSMGIQGYIVNMCFVSASNPGGCVSTP
jgi:hypothetical protein